MPATNSITITGNLAADPELRRTASETPFATMRVAVSHRVLNRSTNEWEDRLDGFFDVTAWAGLALHARTSLRRGDRVTVTGKLVSRSFTVTGETGTQTRHTQEIKAEDLGPSLRYQPWTRLDARPVEDRAPHPSATPEPTGPVPRTDLDADHGDGVDHDDTEDTGDDVVAPAA